MKPLRCFELFVDTVATYLLEIDPLRRLLPMGASTDQTLESNVSPDPGLATGRLSASDICFSHVQDLRKTFQFEPNLASARLSEYYSKYSLAFPDETERSALSRLEQSLSNPASTLNVFAFLLGNEVGGGAHFKLLTVHDSTFCALEYLWVAPEMRGKSFGRSMNETLNAYLTSRGVACVIAEFQDPALSHATSQGRDSSNGITPDQRLVFWKKMGFQAIDAPYICPPVVGQSSWNCDSLVGVYVFNQERFEMLRTSSGYRDMVRAYWDTFNTDYTLNSLYRSFSDEIELMKELKLIPLDMPRTHLPNLGTP